MCFAGERRPGHAPLWIGIADACAAGIAHLADSDAAGGLPTPAEIHELDVPIAGANHQVVCHAARRADLDSSRRGVSSLGTDWPVCQRGGAAKSLVQAQATYAAHLQAKLGCCFRVE